ncbi:hypothetical protein ASG57_31880 [Bradyrhizobium sp. Leaf396]|nr:hypothetical protein ASG57_31880 [Bradyrhizobium sp. Leaf396]
MQLTDRAKHFLAIAKDDPEFPEVLIAQIPENGEVDMILKESPGVGRHAQLLKPVFDLLHSMLDVPLPGIKPDYGEQCNIIISAK